MIEAKKQAYSQAAPWSSVPGLAIVSVEHPFIIKNIDKGIETLGGNGSMLKVSLSHRFVIKHHHNETN